MTSERRFADLAVGDCFAQEPGGLLYRKTTALTAFPVAGRSTSVALQLTPDDVVIAIDSAPHAAPVGLGAPRRDDELDDGADLPWPPAAIGYVLTLVTRRMAGYDSLYALNGAGDVFALGSRLVAGSAGRDTELVWIALPRRVMTDEQIVAHNLDVIGPEGGDA